MPHPRPAGRCATGARLVVGLLISLLLLMGCANGDFGRPKYAEALHASPPYATDPIYTAGLPASAYPRTDEERELRKLADGLFGGPYQHGVSPAASAAHAYGPMPAPLGLKPEIYAARIVDGPFRSATARYARLIDDTRSDIARLDQFFTAARRVADLDRKREQSLVHVSALSDAELAHARRRMRENMMLMAEVHAALMDRVAMYRFTLERLVISVPSPMAVEAERVRIGLEQRLGAIKVAGPAVAVAASVAVAK